MTNDKTISIIDWDNTLMPVYHICNEPHYFKTGYASDETKRKMIELEIIIIKMITELMKTTKVSIITNANLKWVHMSSSLYFPELSKMLSEIEIISARDEYGDKYPYNPKKWKYESFKKYIDKEKNNESKFFVISIADGEIEKNVLKQMSNEYDNFFIKVIELPINESVNHIIKELNIVINKMEHILTHDGNMHLKLAIK